MNTVSSVRRIAFALGCVFSLALVSAQAADVSAQPRADKAAALPVSSTFTKVDGAKGPYVLSLKNTSAKTLKVSVAVDESVKSHSKPRQRTHDHTIEAGQAATVEELAAHDKIVVSAEGFEPLTLVVP